MTDTSVFEDKKAAYYTLGCKLNFAETSTIGRSLLAQGVRSVRPREVADICVINTCSVTELADKKCRTMIRKAAREHPGSFVVVTGCYAQLSPEEIADIEGVHLVIGSEKKLDIADYLDLERPRDAGASIVRGRTKDIRTFRLSSSSDERTRHFLKVQDGCDYHCTYCTIPKARGRSRSGSIAEIVAEAERIAREGAREIVLTGVNIGDFGKGHPGEDFFALVKALDEVEGIERFRIGSIEPNLLSEEIIRYCATSRRIAPHFHIPLQSGSDEVLRLMKRRYDTALFRSRVELIRELMPHAFIGVDVIVAPVAKRSATSRNAISSSRAYPSPSSTSSATRSAKARQPSPSSMPSRPETSTSAVSVWPASLRSVCRTSTAPTSIVSLRSSGSTATMTAA